jgi:hypothetical protein
MRIQTEMAIAKMEINQQLACHPIDIDVTAVAAIAGDWLTD